jgi:tripartite-type tricarboxylate transporter receptor subunit TctC
MIKRMGRWIAGCVLAASAAAALAQGWPSRPITIVVAYPAGGDTDALARMLAEKLQPRLGQPVLIDNRPGASGVIGTNYVARATPDGYTLLLAPSTFTMAQLVLKTAPSASYDVRNGFTPIIQTGLQPLFLAAGPATSARTVKEAVDESKKTELTFASAGSGSPMHILGEMFNKAAGANFRHVPYRGVAPALTDVAGGHVPLTWMTYGPVEPYLADGKLRLLGVAQAERTPLAPQVPTLAEQGYKGVEVSAWNGLYGPKGLPADVVSKLNAQINEIIRMPDIVAKMKALGVQPVGGPPEVLAKITNADLERFTRVVKELNIQAD